MKTMIWKELRENARWAALAGLGLLLAEVFALSRWRGRAIPLTDGVTLCSDLFLPVSAFGCAAVGFTLGLLQIAPEVKRDRWAYLLHRPSSPTALFAGKVIAGLLLFAAAAGGPLLLCIGWVAAPHQFPAPFVPGLVLAPASDLLLGVFCYFSALLLTLVPGRWWGRRGIVGIFTVGVLAMHISGAYHVVAVVLGIVLVAVAAWGALAGVAGSRVTRWALGLVLLLGWQAGLQWLAAGAQKIGSREVFRTPGTSDFEVTRDGTVLLHDQTAEDRFTTTAGQPITLPPEALRNGVSLFLDSFPLGNRVFRSSVTSFSSLRVSAWYVQGVDYDSEAPEIWYLLPQRNYFIGYDRLSRRELGICDTDGLKPPGAVPHPFPDRLAKHYWTSFFSAGSRIYRYDFVARQMSLLYDGGSDPVVGVMSFPLRTPRPRTAVALESGVRIFDADGQPLFSSPYGHDAARWPELEMSAKGDFTRLYLKYSPSYDTIWSGQPYVVYLDELDAQGRLIASYQTPPAVTKASQPAGLDYLAHLAQMPAPVLLADLDRGSSKLAWAASQLAGYSGYSLSKKAERLFLLALALGCGALAALWAWRVRLPRAQAVRWVVVSLLFGIAGLLAYRLAARWSARVPCPACGRRRSVRGATCPHCHSAWTAPAANGAEIFEPLGAEPFRL